MSEMHARWQSLVGRGALLAIEAESGLAGGDRKADGIEVRASLHLPPRDATEVQRSAETQEPSEYPESLLSSRAGADSSEAEVGTRPVPSPFSDPRYPS